MNDGITIGAVISGFVVTWGWLVKISYKLGKIEEKMENVMSRRRRR